MAALSNSIVIYYSQSDGFPWAKFVERKLSEDQYGIPSQLCDVSTMDNLNSEFDVIVALISPNFLSSNTLRRLNQCNSDRSLAVLLGVKEEELRNLAEKVNAFNILDWVTYELEATEIAVKALLMTIIELYEKIHGGEEQEDHPDDPIFQMLPNPQSNVTDSSSDSSQYSRLPPARQVNAVHKVVPFTDEKGEQVVYIFLDRKAEGTVTAEFDNQRFVKTELMSKCVYKMVLKDEHITSSNTHFEVWCGSQKFGQGHVTSAADGQCSMLPSKDSSRLDKMRQLLQEETDPICLLCQALRIPTNSRQQLDITLARRCEGIRSLHNMADMLAVNLSPDTSSEDMWPTLLHFSAEYNLPSFTQELLKLPSMADGCHMKNRSGDKPLDIAKKKGHMELVCMIEDYLRLQKRRGNVPGNKDSGFQPDEVEDDDVVDLNWHFSTTDDEGGIWSPTDLDHPTYHLQKKMSPYLSQDFQRDSQASSCSNKSEDYEGGDEKDNASVNSKEMLGTQLERQIKPNTERMQRSLSDKVKNDSNSKWYVYEETAKTTGRNMIRRKSESDTQHIGTDSQQRNSGKGIKKKISSYFKIPSRRKGSLPCDPISEEKLSDYANRSNSDSSFPCSPVHITHTEVATEEDNQEPIVERKSKKSKIPFKTKAKRRKSVRMCRVLKDDNISVLELPKHPNPSMK